MKIFTRVTALLLCLVLAVAMVGCDNLSESQGGSATETVDPNAKSCGYSGTVSDVTFELADLGEEVNIHTERQQRAINYALDGEFDKITTVARGGSEWSHPEPVVLNWFVFAVDDITGYTVNVSENMDMSDPYFTGTTTTETEIRVYNLELATTYYWTVTATVAGKDVTSGVAVFTVSGQSPRNLYADGITNVRDMGGWETESGGRVKQGMLYRSARLNNNVVVTEDTIYTMKTVLGIRSEIDLRQDDDAQYITESPLGADVTYVRYPMTAADNIILNNPEQIKQVMTFLADESNYPILFHCSIGTDRTGAIAYLVNGLLGVTEEDLYLDYMYSHFGNIGGIRSVQTAMNYTELVSSYEGDTLSEKIYNYLVGVGVPSEQLGSIIGILTEE